MIQQDHPPAIVVVTIDDCGNEFIGCYGEGPPESQPDTPFIDALAASGMRFENYYSCPVCTPTRAAMLTGRHPNRYGLGHALDRGDPRYLPLSEVCVPEVDPLQRFFHVGKWHLGKHWGGFDPILQGFDLRVGTHGNVNDYFGWKRQVAASGYLVETDQSQYVTQQTTDNALIVMSFAVRPYVLWLNFHAPHIPYHDPPGYSTDGSILAQYMAMIEYLDGEIGRIVADLDLSRDWLILCADNGSEEEVASTGGHKAQVKEGGINVPLIVAGPGVPVGSVTTALASSVDVHATVLNLLGVGSTAEDSRSLVPVFLDPSAVARDHVYVERFTDDDMDGVNELDFRAARDHKYKLRWENGSQSFHNLWASRPGEDGPPLDIGNLDDEEQASYDRLHAIVLARGR